MCVEEEFGRVASKLSEKPLLLLDVEIFRLDWPQDASKQSLSPSEDSALLLRIAWLATAADVCSAFTSRKLNLAQ